jgi:hypothetical protein
VNRDNRAIRWLIVGLLVVSGTLSAVYVSRAKAQASRSGQSQQSFATDVNLTRQVIAARRNYQVALEQLHDYYSRSGDAERERWAEDELKQFHRLPKPAYLLDLDVAGPDLHPDQNVPAANDLYRKAMSYKGKGFGSEHTDNLIRTELLLQQLLSQYPSSNRCSDAAYQLGDIYETRRPPQYARAAVYFERSVQWNPATTLDARLRAAKLYDRQLRDRTKAVEWYKSVLNHENDDRRRQEAQRRISELGG